MAKNRDLLEEKGSEMAREGVFACVARIVWQLHRRQSPHSGRPRIGADSGTGSCTHAAHLTVAAHGPGLFEGSRDRLPKLALKMLYKSRRNHDLGRTATLEACTPILRLSFSLDRTVRTPAAPHSLIATGRLRRPE